MMPSTSSRSAERRAAPVLAEPVAAAASDDETLRTAYHESGHIAACDLLGGRITGPVSIEATKRWNGIAYVRAPGYSVADVERFDPGLPVALYPARLRRSLETSVLIYLSGPASEKFRPMEQGGGGYTEDPRHDEVQAAEVVASLTSRDAKLLARGDDDSLPPILNDTDGAHDAARTLGGSEREHALLHFLYAETDLLVDGVPFVCNPSEALRGDDPRVLAYPHEFVRFDDDEGRRAYWAA